MIRKERASPKACTGVAMSLAAKLEDVVLNSEEEPEALTGVVNCSTLCRKDVLLDTEGEVESKDLHSSVDVISMNRDHGS